MDSDPSETKKSSKKKRWRKISKVRLLGYLAWIASGCSIISFFMLFAGIFSDKAAGIVYAIAQGLLMLGLISIALYTTILRERTLGDLTEKELKCESVLRKLTRQQAFSASFEEIHLILHDLRNTLLIITNPKRSIDQRREEAKELFPAFVQKAVDNLQKVFARTSDPKCRVCVKQLRKKEDGKLCVETLRRDAGSRDARIEKPEAVD